MLRPEQSSASPPPPPPPPTAVRPARPRPAPVYATPKGARGGEGSRGPGDPRRVPDPGGPQGARPLLGPGRSPQPRVGGDGDLPGAGVRRRGHGGRAVGPEGEMGEGEGEGTNLCSNHNVVSRSL